jgi:hypothetical protein
VLAEGLDACWDCRPGWLVADWRGQGAPPYQDPYLARGEQAAYARGVAVDAPRQLGLGDAQINPERVKLPDHGIGLGELARCLLIRRNSRET